MTITQRDRDLGTAYAMKPAHTRTELTSVVRGTPMGELLRRYWHPVGLTSDATDTPKKVRALAEDLILFRDKHGRVDSYTLHFAPRVSPSAARALLRRSELPADAKLVRVKRSDNCVIVLYRSEAAKRALGSASVVARLYSHGEGLYTGRVRNVWVTHGLTGGC